MKSAISLKYERIWYLRWKESIQGKESKSSDIHGVICETTKYATATVGICEYNDVFSSDSVGSFRFKPKKSDKNTEIQCFQQVKPGFEVKKHSRVSFIALDKPSIETAGVLNRVFNISLKCLGYFMFISITDLNIEPTDDSTYLAITSIDVMLQPHETMRFDKNTLIEYGKWIQVRFPDENFII